MAEVQLNLILQEEVLQLLHQEQQGVRVLQDRIALLQGHTVVHQEVPGLLPGVLVHLQDLPVIQVLREVPHQAAGHLQEVAGVSL